ncbi:MAG: NYN domain-containing protein [Pirellulaceae bacterium]
MAKSKRILIDGYNLLFQSLLVGRDRKGDWLQRARRRLIQWLCRKLDAPERTSALVVFDAHRSRRVDQAQDARVLELVGAGIEVCFAAGYDEADDLLEEMIRKHPHPKTLQVISSDHRIQKKALARKCGVEDSELFWDRLEKRPDQDAEEAFDGTHAADERRSEISSSPPADVEGELDQSEVEFWLRKFGVDRDEE